MVDPSENLDKAVKDIEEKFEKFSEGTKSIGGAIGSGLGKGMRMMSGTMGATETATIHEFNDGKTDAERIKEQNAEAEAKAKEKRDSDLAELDEKEKEAEDKIRAGPNPPVSWFTSAIVLFISGIIDSALAIVPGGGDFTGLLANLAIWFIPVIWTFDIGSMGKIGMFFLIDTALGLLVEVLGVGTFGLGFALNPIIDFIPEAIGIIAGIGPHKIVKNGYLMHIPTLLEHNKNLYNQKRAIVKKDGAEALKHFKKRIRGHFDGLAQDRQKVVAFLLYALIVFFGPFVSGLLTIQNPGWLAGGIAVLVLLQGFKFINMREMIGLIVGIFIMIIGEFLLFGDQFGVFQGNGGNIGKFALLIVGFMYNFKLMGWFKGHHFNQGVVILLLILSLPVMWGYFTSDRFDTAIDRSLAETQAQTREFNLLEELTNYFVRGQQRGSGELIDNAQIEETTEFIGLRLEDASPRWEEISQTKRQFIDITYSANVPFEILVETTCTIDGFPGQVERSPLPIRSGVKQERCYFDSLPLGFRFADVRALYNYRSTVRIPLKFLDDAQLEVIGVQDVTPEEFVGGSEPPITDSGPVKIGVSNARENGVAVLKMPIVVSRYAPEDVQNEIIAPLSLQFQNVDEGTGRGGVVSINKAEFRMPQGLEVRDCFFDGSQTNFTRRTDDDNWYFASESIINDFDELDKLVCDLYIDWSFIDNIVPENDWKQNTIEFSVDYFYRLEKATDVFEVIE